MNDLTLAAVSALASGGLTSGLAAAWATRKKIPVEVDSIVVTGAETAVQSLSRSLAAETARADRAELQVLDRDKRIEALEARLDALQQALNAAYEELHSIRNIGNDC